MSGHRIGQMTGFHLLRRLAGLAGQARRRANERALIGSMSDRELWDAGLTRATLAYELNKPFWRD